MRRLLTLLAAVALGSGATSRAAPNDYFAIQVIDEATGRGVPLVRLESTDRQQYYTDSNGYVAFLEPGLMNEDVWFTVTSYGYEFPHEWFGSRGARLRPTPGGKAQLKVRRTNIAERLYRVTGRGIYRDTVLLGLKPPLAEPLLNGRVVGQDSAMTAVYRGKLYWFWGDTTRPAHPLGNFFTTGATSELPARGGLDPAAGVDLTYFLDPQSGFTKKMAPAPGQRPGPVWVGGVLVTRDDRGRERLLTHFARVKDLTPVERGLMVFNDATTQFDLVETIPLDAPLAPVSHPLRVRVSGEEYYYFPSPYPAIRAKNDWRSLTDLSTYEGYTCLKDGGRYARNDPPLDRDATGRLLWKWRRNTPPLRPEQIDELVSSGKIRREESPFRLANAEDGRPIRVHDASVYWNDCRRAWAMVATQMFGDSVLGEVWYAEAAAPEGPWTSARKVATHARPKDAQDFYNPLQHPYFAQEGGRLIYFEGTYVSTFSGNPLATPRYDYNQLMYRLDLAEPRLKLPPPAKDVPGDIGPSRLGP